MVPAVPFGYDATMCLIAFALDCHPRYSLVLAANRDEYRERETEPARYWEDVPHLLAGRDRLAGGTWLGVTTGGRLAAITNYRDMRQQTADPPSRGTLVADYLRDDTLTPERLQARLATSAARYNGFNLLFGSLHELHYCTNRGGSSGPVAAGVHALSNHLLDTHWPKAVIARERLTELLRQPELTPAGLLAILADTEPFSDELLPDTGIGLDRERFLSPLFITGSFYGTRTTTVILAERDGTVTFCEQGHDRPGTPLRSFSFRLP